MSFREGGAERGDHAAQGASGGLYSPSLGRFDRRTGPRDRPWSVRSLFWMALLGGVVPYTLLAYLNGRRLGLSSARLRLTVALGTLGALGVLAGGYADTLDAVPSDAYASTLVAARFVGIGVHLVVYRLQKVADRIYYFYNSQRDEAYSSVAVTGSNAVLWLGCVLQDLGMAGLVAWLSSVFG